MRLTRLRRDMVFQDMAERFPSKGIALPYPERPYLSAFTEDKNLTNEQIYKLITLGE